jgi:hypothetical protein
MSATNGTVVFKAIFKGVSYFRTLDVVASNLAYISDPAAVPPAPTGGSVVGNFSNVFVTTAAASFSQGHGYAKTRVYGAEYTGALPIFSAATKMFEFVGTDFSFPSKLNRKLRIWLTWVSVDGGESLPAGGTNGFGAETGKIANVDLGDLIIQSSNIAAGGIAASNFASDIQPVGFVPSGSSLPTIKSTELISWQGRLYKWNASATPSPAYEYQIPGTDIKADSITAAQIAVGAITASELAVGAIAAGSAAIANGAIGNAMIGNLAVDTAKIADTAITTAKIADANITTAKIADANITTAKIGTAQVDTLQLAGQSVTLPVFAYTAGGIGGGGFFVTIQSITANYTGAPVMIQGSFEHVAVARGASSGLPGAAVSFRIQRDGVTIWDSSGVALDNSIQIFNTSLLQDVPSAGAHTYTLQASSASGETHNKRGLLTLETKR